MSPGVVDAAVAGATTPTGVEPALPPRGPGPTWRAWLRTAKARGLAGPLGVITLGFILVAFAAHQLVWLHHYRSGLPLDIDEAGYLRFAFDNLHGWHHGGIGGLYDAVVGQRQFGPLVPLTATPVLGLVGPKPVAAMSVQLVFVALMAFAVLGLGRAVAGPRAGLLAAFVTILIPEILDYTRTFHFAIASGALLTATVWALVRSQGLQRRGWALAAGAFVGGMLLARTLTVAFIPVLGVAAVLIVAARPPRERLRSAVNLALAAVTAVAVAGWWYLPNLTVVGHYLTDVGYGPHSRSYQNNREPLASVAFWTWRFTRTVEYGIYLLPAAVAAVAVIAATVTWARRRRATPRRPRIDVRQALAGLTTPAGIVGVVAAGTYLVLATNRGGGSGFEAPLIPLVVVLLVGLLWSLTSHALRNTLISSLVAASALTAASKATVTGSVAGPRCVHLPTFQCVTIVDGRGVAQQQPWATTIARVSPALARRGPDGHWLTSAAQAATFSVSYARTHGVEPVVFFGSRDPLFNTNTVGLAGRIRGDWTIPMGQLDSGRGDTVGNYRRQLTDPKLGWPNLLITLNPGPYEFRPPVNQATAERAARGVGFTLVDSLRLPDGRVARFFWLPRGPKAQP